MRMHVLTRSLFVFLCLSLLIAATSNAGAGQTPSSRPTITIETTSAQTEYEVGQHAIPASWAMT